VIILAHNCSVLRIPFDSVRLFTEPPGNYSLALGIVADAVAASRRRAEDKTKNPN